MKMLIDIPKELYDAIPKTLFMFNGRAAGKTFVSDLIAVILGGTPIPDNATNGEWVDVDERLPEDAYGCLVTVYDTDLRTQDEFENLLPYFVGYDGETWNNFCGEPIPFEVVAWMKLPTPYQKGGK